MVSSRSSRCFSICLAVVLLGLGSLLPVPASAAGTVTLAGRWMYRSTVQDIGIPYARVEIWEKDGPLVDRLRAVASTGRDGSFRADVSGLNPSGASIYTKVFAESERRVAVVTSIWPNSVYSYQSPTYQGVGGASYSLGTHVVVDDNVRRAFFIFDTYVTDAYEYLRDQVSWTPPDKLSVRWGGLQLFTAPSRYDDESNTIVIEAPDGWNENVLLHEYGHFAMDQAYSNQQFPESPNCQNHTWFLPSSEGCAWVEGWATFFQSAVKNAATSSYDSSTTTNIEAPYLRADRDYVPYGPVDEGAVAASLWDIYDAQAEPWDTLATGINNAGLGGIWNILRESRPATMFAFEEAWRAGRNSSTHRQVQAILRHHGICRSRANGDANCDQSIDLEDFSAFREEFVHQKTVTLRTGDFNDNGVLDLLDFEAFRKGYINSRKTAQASVDASTLAERNGKGSLRFAENSISALPGEQLYISLLIDTPEGMQLSGTDIEIRYTPHLLSFTSAEPQRLSLVCEAYRPDGFNYGTPLRIADDSRRGVLRISRAASSDDSTLPLGEFCLGTLVFTVRDNMPLPLVAGIQIGDHREATGPHGKMDLETTGSTGRIDVLVGDVAQLPPRPSNLSTVDASNGGITVRWNDAATNENGYRVLRWSEADGWQAIGSTQPDATSFTDKGVVCGSLVTYVAVAFNDAGESAPSDWAAHQTPACIPTAPTELLVEVDATGVVSLRWKGDAAYAEGYHVYRRAGTTGSVESLGFVDRSQRQFVDAVRACGISYSYRVTAANRQDESSPTSWLSTDAQPCAAQGEHNLFLPHVAR
jgi:hypothetical protein